MRSVPVPSKPDFDLGLLWICAGMVPAAEPVKLLSQQPLGTGATLWFQTEVGKGPRGKRTCQAYGVLHRGIGIGIIRHTLK